MKNRNRVCVRRLAEDLMEREFICLPKLDDEGLTREIFKLSQSPQRITDTFHSLALLAAACGSKHRSLNSVVEAIEQFALLIACAKKANKK